MNSLLVQFDTKNEVSLLIEHISNLAMEHNLLFGYYPLPKPQAGIELKDQRKPVKLAVKRIVHSKLCGTAKFASLGIAVIPPYMGIISEKKNHGNSQRAKIFLSNTN